MKAFRPTASFTFYLLQSGYQAFKTRLKEELSVRCGMNLDDYEDDDQLYSLYLQGEPMNYIIDGLCGQNEN